MQPIVHDIEIKRGTDYNLDIQMVDDNNNPVDVSGFEWKAQLRERPETGLHYVFSISTIPEEGKVTLSMPHDVTDQIMFHNGVYDLFYTSDNSLRECLLQGKVSMIWKATEL